LLKTSQDGALSFYAAGEDTLAQVRVHCCQGATDRARDLVEKTGDRAAAHHLARFYESLEQIDLAIKYYTKAECFNSAIRLARAHGMRSEMLTLAMRASKVHRTPLQHTLSKPT
jgi:intraflagellar transport protein 140